jgi:predicted phosphohydrolase
MENNTPNTPAELLAMQKAPEFDTEAPTAFADYISEVAARDFEPSMGQALRAAERLLVGVRQWHFDVIIEQGEEMHPEQLKLWKRDYKRLRKAVELIATIEEC